MDDMHREFFALAAAAQLASDEEFPAAFEKLVDYTHKHFESEGQLMRACGFPAIDEHESEHRRVLGELDYLLARIKTGRLTMARAYTEGLPIWISRHLQTMDSALAACVKSAAAHGWA